VTKSKKQTKINMIEPSNDVSLILENASLLRETTINIENLHAANEPEGTTKIYGAKVKLFKVWSYVFT
jgi:hypothetical protein